MFFQEQLNQTHFCNKNKIKKVTQVSKQGRNIVKVTMKTAQEANRFVANFQAKDPNYEYYLPKYDLLTKGVMKDISVPKYGLLTKGVMKDISVEFRETELSEMISSSHKIHSLTVLNKVKSDASSKVGSIPNNWPLGTF